jgi:hypothetical protein
MKITYLFGAGASRNAVPIVSEIPDRLNNIIVYLEQEENQLSNTETWSNLAITNTKLQVQKKLIEDLKWIYDNSLRHASIDTFAKKLFVKHQYDDLNKLKAAFSVYLVLEQTLTTADKRYDSFYASLLKEDIRSFPIDVRILSWNYDFQFEKSFSEYTDNKEISLNQDFLNVITKYSYDVPKNNKFAILKLNGSTNLLQDRGFRKFQFFSNFSESIDITFLDSVVRNYAALLFAKSNLFSGLSFAWEQFFDEPERNIVNISKNETSDTEILIVIGYSFPYFNREIDREIICNMPKLSKVYFQAPDAEVLKERFYSIRADIPDEKLVTRFDVGQFLLPNEL